jgi:hypothetical protein
VPGLLDTWHVLLLQLGDLAEAGEGVTRLLALCPHVTVLFVPGPPAIVKLVARFLSEGWETAQHHLLPRAGRRAGRPPQSQSHGAAAATAGGAPSPPPVAPATPPGQPLAQLPRAFQRFVRHPAVAATVADYARALALPHRGGGGGEQLPPEWATPQRFLLSMLAALRDLYGVPVVLFNAPA